MVKLIFCIYLIIFCFSCSWGDEEKVTITDVKIYRRYCSYGTSKLVGEYQVKYSYSYLNDSVILLKMYDYLGLHEKSVRLVDNMGKEIYDTLGYQNYYLSLKSSSKKFISHDANEEHFILEAKRDYIVQYDTLKIMSFYREHDNIDGDNRIYFSPQIGYLAEYGISGFHARISSRTNDPEKEKYRVEVVDKLISDTTFFPFPEEVY